MRYAVLRSTLRRAGLGAVLPSRVLEARHARQQAHPAVWRGAHVRCRSARCVHGGWCGALCRHTRAHSHVQTRARTHTLTRAITRALIRTQAQSQACACARNRNAHTRTCTRARSRACACARTQVQVCVPDRPQHVALGAVPSRRGGQHHSACRGGIARAARARACARAARACAACTRAGTRVCAHACVSMCVRTCAPVYECV